MNAANMKICFDLHYGVVPDFRAGVVMVSHHPRSVSGSVCGARATSGSGARTGTQAGSRPWSWPWSRSRSGPWRWSWSGSKTNSRAASRSLSFSRISK